MTQEQLDELIEQIYAEHEKQTIALIQFLRRKIPIISEDEVKNK